MLYEVEDAQPLKSRLRPIAETSLGFLWLAQEQLIGGRFPSDAFEVHDNIKFRSKNQTTQ